MVDQEGSDIYAVFTMMLYGLNFVGYEAYIHRVPLNGFNKSLSLTGNLYELR